MPNKILDINLLQKEFDSLRLHYFQIISFKSLEIILISGLFVLIIPANRVLPEQRIRQEDYPMRVTRNVVPG